MKIFQRAKGCGGVALSGWNKFTEAERNLQAEKKEFAYSLSV
jgi:hypothetical protein